MSDIYKEVKATRNESGDGWWLLFRGHKIEATKDGNNWATTTGISDPVLRNVKQHWAMSLMEAPPDTPASNDQPVPGCRMNEAQHVTYKGDFELVFAYCRDRLLKDDALTEDQKDAMWSSLTTCELATGYGSGDYPENY